ncbi:hypothetical protein HER32_08760 [Hymenobacter sp. BT18]|uniref:hypothetical protein n=1 Tax=Hymenobacter sp. BT18 TaxID=2835648 RepID=UPI00143E1168|nr:hypothetical protein [Hymenobacter sp. BT18]QIX61264.1 hypothetical protein HER32_08760 [Hymenobacter sp. BT18]
MNKHPWLYWWLQILLVLGGAVLPAGYLVGFKALLQPRLDIQMHNTYFIISPFWLVLAMALPLVLLIWLVRHLAQRLK